MTIKQDRTTRPRPEITIKDRGALLVHCMSALERAGIETCMLHGYEGFPADIPSDVDFMAREGYEKRLGKELANALEGTGWRLVNTLQHEASCYYYVVCGMQSDGSVEYLHLDCAHDYRRNGRVFIHSADCIAARAKHGEFWVASAQDTFAYYLIKKIAKLDLSDDHGVYLSSVYKRAPTACRVRLGKFWSASCAETLTRAAASEEWRPIQADLGKLRRDLLRTSGRGRPYTVFRFWIQDVFRAAKRVARPTGMLLAILGPDGSGKSAVISQVCQDLQPAFRRAHRGHWRPFVLGAGRSREKGPTRPHDDPPYSLPQSLTKLAYLWVDFVAGYFLSIRPRLVRSTLVVFDRYAADLLADPRRYRYGGPRMFADLAIRLVPQPAETILLDALPASIVSRKNELTEAELPSLVAAYRLLARRRGYAVVGADEPLECVVVKVETLVLDYLSKRALRRLGLRLG